MVECQYCHNVLINKKNLSKHIIIYHKYRCHKCKLTFKTYAHSIAHYGSDHYTMDGGISKRRRVYVKNKNYIIIAPSERKRGALWCNTCMSWSRGCTKLGHNTRFKVFT